MFQNEPYPVFQNDPGPVDLFSILGSSPGKEPDSSTASLLRGELCTFLAVLRSRGERNT